MAGLVAAYALVSLVLVTSLGVFLAMSYRGEAQRRGIAEGASEAALIARTAIEPQLDGRQVADGLTPAEIRAIGRVATSAVAQRDVLRLRVRDQNGLVRYSDDGSGFQAAVDDEVLDAASGEVVSLLTHLNADANDVGGAGVDAVEVYLPLRAGTPLRQVGVLETYLPYAPIDADVGAGMATLYRDLAVGLAILYVGLFAMAWSITRGLRRQLHVNRHLADHDPLTDLPNRAAFLERVRTAVRSVDTDPYPTAVAIIDLDRFKEVNDTLGHDSGDALIAELAQRLSRHIRGEDSVARLGGDEFGIVLRNVADPEAALWRVREIIEAEVCVQGLPLTIDSSIGLALAPEDGLEPETLLQRADVAMYLAKAKHAGVLRYDPARDHYDAENLALIAGLRRAIEDDELVVHYQPKIRLSDNVPCAVEALVRWQHPTLGLLAPDRFVPMAEQTDLIDQLTPWVIKRALADISGLGPIGGELEVAVNVSARNLARADFASVVERALCASAVDPGRLIVEITETALLVDPDRAAAVLAALNELGVAVSLDDFGVGHTSLGYLASLPIDELKIDRSFVTDLLHNPTHFAIARSITDLASSLGLRVVAEGVETEDVADELRALGCTLAQGYYFARPMTAESLGAWLTRERVPVALG
jgi:diguanylate cyclase (GGDEF)-like protein